MDSASTTRRPSIVVVMGVSGCGKSLFGAALAKAMGAAFAEGDSYHPAANIARMSSGLALRDEDRWGWLDAIADEIAEADRNGRALVVTCSALKRAYRDRLRLASGRISFVYLDVGRDTAAARVAGRKGHFMPASLIDSQFAALEPPTPDEKAIAVDASRDPGELVGEVLSALAGPLPASHT